MLEKEFVVKYPSGLHARPVSELVKTASNFNCNISIRMGEATANAKSIIEVLCLGAAKGSILTISADGNDEALALHEVMTLLDSIAD